MSDKVIRTIRLDDGRLLTATIKIADFVAFERHFNMEAPLSSSRIEYWAFLTWSALKRQGDVTAEFDDFLGELDEFIVEDAPANGDAAPKAPRSKKASPVS